MKTRSQITAACLAPALLLLVTASVTRADVVYVTACVPNTSTLQNDGSYTDFATGSTGIAGTGAGAPARTHSRYFSTSFQSFVDGISGIYLTPTLGVAGGVYQIDHNFSSLAGNVSPDISLTATCTVSGTLSFWNTGANFTSAAGNPNNQWKTLGFLTNAPGSTTPTIEFGYLSGAVDAAASQRLLTDAFRFSLLDPCLSVTPPNVQGPLATNVSQVAVANVTSNATAVGVYQDSGGGMVKIGELTNGVVAGVNVVPVSGLVKNASVSATQTEGGQESCIQPTGKLVGGGANPRIRVALSIRETGSTGPVGASGSTTNANLHFLGATFRIGSAPGDGVVVTPSTAWQTVAFPQNSPSVQWNGVGAGDTNNIATPWGVLDAIAFAIDDLSNTGPYNLYIDNLQNGATVFQNWEGFVAGQQDAAFRSPRFSGSTSGNLLAAPDRSITSNGAADTGTKSLNVQFQWDGTNSTRWVRFTTSGVGNPQVNLAEDISFRMLLLPVNLSPVAPPPPSLGIELISNEAVVEWTGAHNLQESGSVTGPFANTTNLSGNVILGPYTNTPAGNAKFFRLVN